MPGSKVNLGNGKWRLYVSNGYDVRGKAVRITKTVTAKSERDADKKLQLFYFEAKKMPIPSKIKIRFEEFVDIWKERYGNTLSPRTIEGNRVVIETRLLPYFGKMHLQKITAEHVADYFRELAQDGQRIDGKQGKLSKGTIHINFRVLRAMFNKAIEWQYLSTNPCTQLPKDERPKPIHEKRAIMHEEELGRFLKEVFAMPDIATNVKYKLMVYLDLFTGIRLGELFALRWDVVDFENKQLRITNSIYIQKGGKVNLKSTKTKSSERVVYIDDTIVQLFKKHKEFQEKWLKKHGIINPEGYVFLKRDIVNKTASIAQPSGFYHWLIAFLKKHNLPKICIHSFRHMAASYALENNVPLTTVQAMMGHSDIATTSIYLHSLDESRRRGAEKMSGMFKSLEHEANNK